MKNISEINGDDNVVILGGINNKISLQINGKTKEIKYGLEELRKEIRELNTQIVKALKLENCKFNIDEINETNLDYLTGKKKLNDELTTYLMYKIAPHDKDLESTLRDIQKREVWNSLIARDIKDSIIKSFVWAIGYELRRLFSIVEKTPVSLDDYFNRCISIYKITLQIINYALIAKLWDDKKQVKLAESKKNINLLFTAESRLTNVEFLKIFKALLVEYETQKITLPMIELEPISYYLEADGEFSMACSALQELYDIGQYQMGKFDCCLKAELHLAKILGAFHGLANYKLVSMRKIEYESLRGQSPRYMQDYSILGNRGETSHEKKLIKYGARLSDTYAVFLKKQGTSLNLFPFVLDYNTLIEDDKKLKTEKTKIYFFENRIRNRGLRYFFLDGEDWHIINYQAIQESISEERSLSEEQRMQLKLDATVLQFQAAQEMLLGYCKPFFFPNDEE